MYYLFQDRFEYLVDMANLLEEPQRSNIIEKLETIRVRSKMYRQLSERTSYEKARHTNRWS